MRSQVIVQENSGECFSLILRGSRLVDLIATSKRKREKSDEGERSEVFIGF